MADGHIKIAIEVDGRQLELTSKDFDKLEDSSHKLGKGVKATEDGLKDVGKESEKATSGIRRFTKSLGLVAVGAAAFGVLKSSMGAAIKRFDTFNNFPKVLEALGVSSEDSSKSIDRLAEGTDGLPTKLDEIASTAQRMYTSFGDMDKATESAIALNNALLGSGSDAAQASRGVEQYLKSLQTGQIDLMTWRSLSETMDVGLVKIAESFGYAGKSAKDNLYNALKDGTITIDRFNDKLIEVGTGTGVMAELARENTKGLGTSLSNISYAFARGITGTLDSLDKLSMAVTGNTIAENIDNMKHIIIAAFNVISNAIEYSIPIFQGLGKVVGVVIDILKFLSPVIIGITTAYLASVAAIKLKTVALTAYRAIAMTASAAQLLMATSTSTMSGAMAIASVAASGFGTALKVMLGPVGWVTAGIGALAGAAYGVIKWFKRESAEAKKLRKETEELGDATNSLNDAVESSQEAYKNSQSEIKGTAKANEELARKVDELANKENKSLTEKKMLQTYTEQLNDSIEDLNLTYDEEADALNMSSEHLKARIDLMKEQDTANKAMERLNELTQEQVDISSQLENVNKLREEYNEKLDEGAMSSKEYKKGIAELGEQEEELMETWRNSADLKVETEQEIERSMDAVARATEKSIDSQIISFDSLSESQKETIESMKSTWEDYKDAATNLFDVLSDEIELSFDDMKENLIENQRVMSEWGDNMAILTKRGVDEGILEKLREMGPESAGYVKAMVEASDEELKELSKIFRGGTKVATDAMEKGLGIENTDILSSVKHLVMNVGNGLRDDVKNAGFESIGAEIGSGVAIGVNNSVEKVKRAARNLANSALRSAKGTLEIRSPSKRAEKEIGAELPAGIAVGIDNNARTVFDSLKNLGRDMLTSTPEMALGTSKMAYSSGGNPSTTNHQTTTENRYNTTNMDGLFNGAVFNVSDDNDIPKLAKEINDYVTGKSRSRGVVMP